MCRESHAFRDVVAVAVVVGTAVLAPNFGPAFENTVVNIAGWFSPGGATTNVEWANAGSPNASNWPTGHLWTASPAPTALPPLNVARQECNAVTLPTGDVLVLGDGSPQRSRQPELLSGGSWNNNLPLEASVRDHHAIGMLLPSGAVLSASGNNRWFDFQVYEPAYMSAGPRPAWGAVPGNGVLLRGQTVTVPITMPPGTAVGKVVLIRSGSLTHHADMDQRYVQLPFIEGDVGTVDFQAPDGPPLFGAPTPRLSAPLGFYMIFLVTTTGVPSVAHFVRFQ